MGFLSKRVAARGADIEARRALRRAVGIRALLRDGGTRRFEVDMIDLSVSGFQVESSFAMRPGTSVWLTMPGVASLEAVVAWRDRYRYGCSFRVPLQQTAFEHIVARNWA